ncbi:hypothetical protein L1887_21111 [Cichorium endivia]|nr:hypothetical protein L1887_21111 [Cichorium endivia]
MEGVTTRLYKGVKGYWRTRGYQRLATTSLHTHSGQEESGSKPRRCRRRRRFWRIRISPRLTLKLKPRKFFIGLRDAYVKIMMKLANSSVVRGRSMSGQGGEGFGTIALKEYDEKMIMEIYKTLAMRQGQLVAQQIPSQVALPV